MYHISKDVRARKSAELIRKGFEECLKEKPLSKIKVSDIYEKSFVSRATFYRLFDGINDIFSYECDAIFLDVMTLLEKHTFADKNEQALCCIKRWLAHETIIKSLVENNLIGLFYDSHMRNVDLLKKFYSVPFDDDNSTEYFINILASMAYASLSIYFRHGAAEPIEKVYATVCRCTGVIAENLTHN